MSFADFVGQKDTYALRVRGNSMIDDHICEGDMILVENSSDARDGDIVVALVGGTETTLKRFYREAGNMIRLQPANTAMSPIRVPARMYRYRDGCLRSCGSISFVDCWSCSSFPSTPGGSLAAARKHCPTTDGVRSQGG